MEKLNSDATYIVENLNEIIDDLKKYDEFMSLVDKHSTTVESLEKLKNTSTLLQLRCSKQSELTDLLKDLETVRELRKDKNELKMSILKDRDEIKTLVESIDIFSEKKAKGKQTTR